ncbi:ras guanine nucleotide exchange factor domain-containing protein [Gloeopeniophorella convolvens]|nr:ras guanine nucleotide exchange factor domain-containing protein [Gloeopeniophorella convolvens]
MVRQSVQSLSDWLDAELKKQGGPVQENHIATKPHVVSKLPRAEPPPPSLSQPIIATQPPEDRGKDAPPEAPEKHLSIFSIALSAFAPVRLSPLEVRMPPPTGDAADYIVDSGLLLGAGLPALIRILTDPSANPNPTVKHLDLLRDTLLLCFRAFCTPQDFAIALRRRFKEERPANLTDEQKRAWPLQLQAIRLRVISIIRSWIDLYWVYEDDRSAASILQHFAESTVDSRWPDISAKIVRELKRRLREADHARPATDGNHIAAVANETAGLKASHRRSTIKLIDTFSVRALDTAGEEEFNSAVLADALIQKDSSAHVLVFNSSRHCGELARQLTLFMSRQLHALEPERLWNHLRKRCYDCHTEQVVDKLQCYDLLLQVWAAKSVLSQANPETQSGVLTFLVALALRCRKLRNFSALISIHGGVKLACAETQVNLVLPEATKGALKELDQLVEGAYDDFIVSVDTRKPTVPFIDWFLQEMKSIREEPSLISFPDNPARAIPNVAKYVEAAKSIRKMEKCYVPYDDVTQASYVQAWISKAFIDVAVEDIDEARVWIEATQSPKNNARGFLRNRRPENLSKTFASRASLHWTRAAITDLVPELLA